MSETLRARLELINSWPAVLKEQVQRREARLALGRQVGIAEPVIPVAPVDLEPRPLRLSEREILEVAERRQLLELGKPEDLEETACGRVEHRTSRHLAVPGNAHQFAFEQAAQDGTHVDAADVLHLGARHRLSVRNDRQRLEGGGREPQWPRAVALLHVARELRKCAQLVTPRHLPDVEGPAPLGVLGIETWPTDANFLLAEAGADTAERLLREGIIVRPLHGFGMPEHIRISVGLPEENERLVKALRRLREGSL